MPSKMLSSPLIEVNTTTLNDIYTFDNFTVGSSNQYAYTAAKSVAEEPKCIYNPIFIYGAIGIGKTHLLHAIGNYAQNEGKVVVYTTIQQFMNDFTENLRNQTMDKFRNKYRTCDVLLIDDIQYLANKFQTQEELYHIFNELNIANKRIVLTADKPLKMIDGLEERLKSRFSGGFITDIGLPELEIKVAIIKKKCEIYKLYLTNDMIDNIVTNTGDDIREIESCIINLTYTIN